MSTSSFSGGKAQPTSPSSQQASRASQQQPASPMQTRSTSMQSQQSTPSQQQGGKPRGVLITAADSLAGATVVNQLAAMGGDKAFGTIVLAVDKDSSIHDKLDAGKMPNVKIVKCDLANPDTNMLKATLKDVQVLALIPPKNETKFGFSRALLKAASDAGTLDAAILLSWTGTNAIDSAKGPEQLMSTTSSSSSSSSSRQQSQAKAQQFPQLSEIKQLEDEFRAASGIPAKTVVRANFYAQNLVTYARQIVEQAHLPVPTRDGKLAPLDAEVLGAALAKLLVDVSATETKDKHAAQTYTLTGPEALDARGIAAALAKALGNPVEPKQISLGEARELLGKARPPLDKSEIDTVLETYALVAQGRLDQVSQDAAKLLAGTAGADMAKMPLSETVKRDAAMFKKVASL